MTFEQLDAELPNGFHDAQLYGFVVDYIAGSMTLRIDLWVGNLDGPDPEEYRPAELRVTGLYFCSLDPPDPNYRFIPDGSPLDVSGDPAKPDTLPALKEFSRTLPVGASCYRFFVHDWNSFIHIAAEEVQVSWIEDGASSAIATS